QTKEDRPSRSSFFTNFEYASGLPVGRWEATGFRSDRRTILFWLRQLRFLTLRGSWRRGDSGPAGVQLRNHRLAEIHVLPSKNENGNAAIQTLAGFVKNHIVVRGFDLLVNDLHDLFDDPLPHPVHLLLELLLPGSSEIGDLLFEPLGFGNLGITLLRL